MNFTTLVRQAMLVLVFRISLLLPAFLIVFTLCVQDTYAQTYIMGSGTATNGATITTCGGTFYDPGGAGGNYSDNQDYAITFTSANVGEQISIEFTSIDLESAGGGACYDYIDIYDGTNAGSTFLGRGCGTGNLAPIVSTTGSFHLVFHSDNVNTLSGWEASITCVNTNADYVLNAGSNGTTVSTCSGTFADPGDLLANYGINENYSMTFSADNGGEVIMDFTSFDLEPEPSCAYDYLEIYDGTNNTGTLFGKYCGTNSPGTITSTTGSLHFVFVADGSNSGAGWEANISCTAPPAGGIADYLISTEGTVNTCSGIFADSGDTEANYGDGENHTMTFCSDENNHISFTFDHFNTESGNDILSIYDGATNAAALIGNYSGFGPANSPGIVTSLGTCLTFEFTSNGSTSGIGWQASISCTGSVSPAAAGGGWSGYPTAGTCGGTEEISGFVFEDIDNDGNRDSRDAGIVGVSVTLFDDDGQVGSPTITDATGEYTFSGLDAATVYRVEFSIPENLTEGPHGTGSNSSVQFIESGQCDANFGLVDAAHYCDNLNPYFAIPCYANGDPQHASNVGTTGIARFRYNDSGTLPSATYENYVSVDAIGTTWGVLYDGEAEKLYMTSFLKRHAGLGPNGIGAIYTHNDGDANNNVSVFYDFGTAAGIVDDNATRFPGSGNGFGQEGPCGACDNVDPNAFAQVGKVGFGDLEIHPDLSKIYVTNLYDRKVYAIDTDNPAPGSATALPGIPWLDNSPCNNGIARPWALEWRRNKLYVGVVCDASLSSCSPGTACSDLTANVYSFDGATWTNELSFPLDYYRAAYASGSDYFVKWIDDWNVMKPLVSNVTDANFGQPIITDIEIDDDMSLIIGIGDRTGYQLGYQSPPPTGPSGSTEERNFVFGDILRAAYDNGTGNYTLENNGVAGSLNSTNPTNNTGPGGKSFYWGDYWTGIGALKHQSGIGSLALLPGSGQVMFPLGDANNYYSNGINWISNINGKDIKRLQVYQGSPDGNSANFSKSSGLGGMDLFCTSAPIEIGNIVWWDDNLNGLQEPGEYGVENVTLELYLDSGGSLTKIAETTSDAYGKYVFSYAGNSNGLNSENWSFTANDKVLPNTTYQVRIVSWAMDTGLTTLSTTLGFTGVLMSPTASQGNGGIIRDSDASDDVGNAVASITTKLYGDNNHSIDFGFGGVGGCDAPETVPSANTPCDGETLNLVADVSGGVSPYSFNWSGPDGFTSNLQNPIIDNIDQSLNAGIYYLTVSDNVACTDTVHIHVTINNVTLSNAVTDATCGVSNGAIDLTIDGYATFNIDWDNNGTGDTNDPEDLSSLAGGLYNVTVSDGDGCSDTDAVSVKNSGSVDLTASHIEETCSAANGSIDLTIVGTPTSISWSNGATTEDLSGLSAGTYNVTVNNAANCSATLSVTLTNTEGPALSVTSTDEICGNSNASTDLTITGGTSPYAIDWDNNGTGDTNDNEDLSNLSAGTYNVTITDAIGCTATTSISITNIVGPSLMTSVTNETCGNGNGNIDLNVAGGTGPFDYNWSNGIPLEDLSGVGAGTYAVTVTDANGCTATTSASISNSDGPSLSLVSTNSTDCNTNNGSIDLTVTGGTGPFDFDWNNDGFGDNDDMEDLSGLDAGSFTVIVTDANGCQANISSSIINTNDPAASFVITDPTDCTETGSIDLTVTGGTMPLTYDWSNDGLGDNDDIEDISGLEGGVYTVIITGADGCTVQGNASIRTLRDPDITATLTAPACGVNDGAITLSISDPDGGGPYTFDWDNDGVGDNDDTQDLTSLAAGNYSLTVTNSISCTTVMTYSLSSDGAPEIAVFQTNPTCGGANGAIDVVLSGGTTPYSIDWDNNGTGDTNDPEDLTGLSNGTYNLTVTDALGCQAPASVVLISSEPPTLSAILTSESCGNADGAIDLSISGVGPFAIDWDNNGTGDTNDPEDLSGLSAGTYNITVTDNNGCNANTSFTITNTTPPVLMATTTPVSCSSPDGAIDLTITGTSPFLIDWDNNGVGDTNDSEDLTGLTVGTYNVTVTDNLGCTATTSVTLTTSSGPVIDMATATNENCGNMNGTINLEVSGGATPYTFDWDNDGTGDTDDNEDLTGLSAGTYNVTVTDNDGCDVTTSVEVFETTPPVLVASSTNENCENIDGAIDLTISGVAPFTIDWDNNGTGDTNDPEDLSGLSAGNYSVTVTDTNGCSATTTEAITTTTAPDLTVSATGEIDGTMNGAADLTIVGAAPFIIDWDNDGTGDNDDNEDLSGLSAGTYNVTVTDGSGCIANTSVEILAETNSEKVAIGNLVFLDANNNGTYDDGIDSGIDEVVVELYPSGASLGIDLPMAKDITSNGGFYLFDTLDAGQYVVYIPSIAFDANEPLENLRSAAPEGGDDDNDDDNDENGANTLINGGITSSTIDLQLDDEPVNENGEGTYVGDLDDNHVNLTVDFAFIQPMDFGDLPDLTTGTAAGDYQTTSANSGPSHIIIPGLSLGSLIDDETDGQASTLADGDGTDEDGFTFSNSLALVPDGVLNLPVNVVNTTGVVAHLEAWIDWNGDGDFDDADEWVVNLSDNGAGSFGITYVNISIPELAVTNQGIGFRVRLSHEDNMTPNGEVNSGEVEDYLIQLDCPENCSIISAQKLNGN